MKQSFIKGIKKNALLIIALIAFVVFTGNRNPDTVNDVAGKCCTGYIISIDKLKQFMLDSLHSNHFEGGVFSKQKLLTAINEIPGDSVYLINVSKNCNVSQKTDLVLTSPQAPGVVCVGTPNCSPCPPKACCPGRVCAVRIDRGCINFQTFTGFANGSGSSTAMVDQ